MRRFFRRPLFPFHDPFLFPLTRPCELRVRVPMQGRGRIQENDPHSTFERFFDEHGVKENERSFFEKHYPEKYEPKFNPYEALGVEKNATLDQIKEAYREKALKFHPKNDTTAEGAKKFQELGRAYNQLTSEFASREQDNLFNSFFHDFDREIQGFFKPFERNAKQNMKQIEKEAEKSTPKEISEEEAKFIENADLYSESTFVQTKNGKNNRVVIEKQYKKDNNILKVRREENYKDDGSKQVTQTLDDGKEVKKKVFLENKEQKKITN